MHENSLSWDDNLRKKLCYCVYLVNEALYRISYCDQFNFEFFKYISGEIITFSLCKDGVSEWNEVTGIETSE